MDDRRPSPGGSVLVSFDVDAEAAVIGAGLDPFARPSLRSHQAYGPEIGVPRLLRVLADHAIEATFFVPGRTAELHPGAVDAILAAGHEVGHHGHEHRPPFMLSEPEERAELEQGLEALGRFGVTPAGYRAPCWEHSPRTLALLGEYGISYDSSLFDRDGPYVVRDEPRMVEVPVCWALDDWERYAFWPDLFGNGVIARPTDVLETWWEEVSAIVAVGGCAVLTMHPFLSGRPARAEVLGGLLERIRGLPGVRIAPGRVLAETTASAGRAPDSIDGGS
jgi:peptidoglycan/xylan/chitin deacetylase (PgdA/CDA1 family)